jgi:hypothetical protein
MVLKLPKIAKFGSLNESEQKLQVKINVRLFFKADNLKPYCRVSHQLRNGGLQLGSR